MKKPAKTIKLYIISNYFYLFSYLGSMAFKRSAVRSRLSPPRERPEIVGFRVFFYVFRAFYAAFQGGDNAGALAGATLGRNRIANYD